MGVERRGFIYISKSIRVFHERDVFDLNLEEWVGFGLRKYVE